MSDDGPVQKSRASRAVSGDLLLGGFALLISALTAGAGWWQTHVIAQQLSSQVWPYVTVSTTSNSQRLAVDLVNDGLGPAILNTFVVLIDGKPQRDLVAALHVLAGHFESDHPDLDIGGIAQGEVLRANSTTLLFAVTNKHVVSRLANQLAGRVTVHMCYCSIVDNCWTFALSGRTSVARPIPVARCPDVGSDQLQEPTPAELEAVR